MKYEHVCFFERDEEGRQKRQSVVTGCKSGQADLALVLGLHSLLEGIQLLPVRRPLLLQRLDEGHLQREALPRQ